MIFPQFINKPSVHSTGKVNDTMPLHCKIFQYSSLLCNNGHFLQNNFIQIWLFGYFTVSGGTVDISAHEQLIDGKVKEIAQPSGGPWGGMAVDAKFMKLLSSVLGPDFINHLKSKLPQMWLDFFMRFEKSKKVFKADGKYEIKLIIPNAFSTEFRNLRGKNIETFFNETEDAKITLKSGF